MQVPPRYENTNSINQIWRLIKALHDVRIRMASPSKKTSNMHIHKRLYLETLTQCTICSGGEEDCTYLFSECPFARTIWNHQSIPSVDMISERSFWDSIRKGLMQKEGGGRILAVLCAIWLDKNDKLSRGRATSTDRVAYAVSCGSLVL